MGGLCTSCRPQVPKDKDSTIKKHGSFLRRKTSISAAFSFGTSPNPHSDEKTSMLDVPSSIISPAAATLDINTAAEEDLMTLPNVGRVVAHNIIEYRRKIGGFRRIEDLVLVSGIGATKLEILRKEIHVSVPKSKSNSESASSSSLLLPLDINKASVEQLAMLDDLDGIAAEKIVQYRNTNGPYSHITDLVDPAGIIDTPTLLKLKYVVSVGNTSNHSRNVSSCSARLTNYHGSGPESLSSSRPTFEPVSDLRNGRPFIRIATWNLQQFSLEKVENPGVREVVCMTLLENGINILAVQELAHKDALTAIMNELNNPTLPNVQRSKVNSGSWKCAVSSTAAGRMYQTSEYNGFLWDTSADITLYSESLLEKPDGKKQFARRPYLGYFKVAKFDVVLVSVHLKAVGYVDMEGDKSKLTEEIKLLPQFVEALKQQVPEEKDLIMLGDFNLEPNESEFDVLREDKFVRVVPETSPTNISTKNMKGSRSYDNMWLSRSAANNFTGDWRVVRAGLTSPWIPNGWSWGGVVSDHCPVWAEFYVDKDSDREAKNKDLDGLKLTIG